jgi:CelD/BcsL family acetyltransferase involved in cellulose biosynthesis
MYGGESRIPARQVGCAADRRTARQDRGGILTPVQVKSIELAATTDSDLGHWRELATQAISPNPFLEPEYVLPLVRGLNKAAEVRLLVAHEGSEWRACLPVHTPGRWHRIPMRSVSTWRGHVLYGLLGTPLLSPTRPDESLSLLLDRMRVADPRAKFAGLDWVADDRATSGPLDAALASLTPAPLAFEQFERAALRRRPEPTYLEETLGSKRRRELRRQRRKLEEALDGPLEMVDCAGEEAALKRFVAIESGGRKGRSGVVLDADRGHLAFFEQMCRSFAELGRLQLFELRNGDRVTAAKCNLLAGDTIFLFKIAYDEAWSSYSPGILLELEMLKFFHEESEADFMDSCADPNNAMINRLWPDRRPITSHALPTKGLTGRASRTVLAAARFVRERKRNRREI